MTPQLCPRCISSITSRRSQNVAVLDFLDHSQVVTMCNPSLRSCVACGSFWPSSSSTKSVRKDGCIGSMRVWKNANAKTALLFTCSETSVKLMRYFRMSCACKILVERTPNGKADCHLLANVLISAKKRLDRLIESRHDGFCLLNLHWV
jgi:hypothetical protein